MLTVAQVATLCEVKPVTVRAWLAAGKLHRNERGKISNADLIEFWDEKRDSRMADLANRRWHRIASV